MIINQTSSLAQDWLEQHCPDFIKKDEWPPNSLELNSLDFHVWGAMLENQAYNPKPKTQLNWRSFFKRSGTIFHKSPSIAQSYSSEANLWRVSEPWAVTSSTYCSCKYDAIRRHQTTLFIVFSANTFSKRNSSQYFCYLVKWKFKLFS